MTTAQIQSQRARSRRHYLLNREAILERQKARQKSLGEPRRKYRRDYYAKNKGKELARTKAKRLKDLYGLTLDEYRALVKKQRGRCLLCDKRPADVLQVDHDHRTGEIRGLLCRHCNLGLGCFKDSPEVLKKAIAYLHR